MGFTHKERLQYLVLVLVNENRSRTKQSAMEQSSLEVGGGFSRSRRTDQQG
jgi:hypothetical protein